jgi:phospholipid/cholesterol/gamma-HCH transport system substrate-binding protein
MNMRPQEKKKVFIAGIFVTILSLISIVFIMLLSKESSIFDRKAIIVTKVQNVQNVKVGAPVKLKGIKVGLVSQIEFSKINEIVIKLKINLNYLQWIKVDSYIAIKTQGVLGDKYIEITGGTEDSVNLADGSSLVTKEIGQFDNIINKGEDILVTAGRVLLKFDLLMDSIQKSPVASTIDNLNKTLASTNKVMKNLDTRKLTRSLNNLEQVTNQIKTGPGTMHSLIYDRSIHDDMKALLGGANRNKVLKYFIRESIQRSEK